MNSIITNGGRILVVGDCHGCLNELKMLLDKCKYTSGDVVCMAGDLIDRGDQSPGLVKFCIENDIKSVMGNHDAKLVRRWRHIVRKRNDPSYKNPMHHSQDQEDTIAALSDREMAWIADLPYYYTLPEVGVVIMHAGLLPCVPLASQTREILTMVRYIDPTGRRMLPVKQPGFLQPDNSVFWAEVYDGTADIVFGHSVVSLDGKIGAWDGLRTGRCYGIDTGVCFGGFLTCMILDTENPKSREIVQVKALREYYKPDISHNASSATESIE